ncbi:type IA DNA topoisomerase [Volucribacter amazonae]|uniref:DNA topoisomerase n=1 Tax=Volucribacter amazonae TaxID=256731 RepID=A0A9X4PDP0_9PAST|nr:DNA topoisomerase 3 [Volucribacter amazonae]MDG6896407.1 conjugal transfer protein TraE [Volucribacter amazonae]
MKLIIAEKPQLGAVIAEAIGIVNRKDGYIECKGNYNVTWAIGHILAIKMPEELNPAYAKWNLTDLPLKLRPLELKPKTTTEKQFKVIESLLRKADTVVNAGDPDDEGQLLIREILEYTGFKGKVQRLLLNDLNIEAAKKAMNNLKPDSEFDGMYYKALARSQADYIFGINLTRAYTLLAKAKGLQSVYSIGRVQTPTLGLIVRRYLSNKHHKESFYYNLSGNFTFQEKSLNAKLVITDNIRTSPNDEESKEKHIIDENIAKEIKKNCERNTINILQCSIEAKTTPAPLPFSLLDLQARINDKYGFSADETLSITQSLREKHKAITYNRSDCRYLSTEQFEAVPKTLDFLAGLFPNLPFNSADRSQKNRAFNDKKVTAHTGIIPVVSKELSDLSNLSDKERKVYGAIVEQYLIQFLPEKQYDLASITIQCKDYQFRTTATKITDYGWSKLVPDDSENENDNTKFDLIVSLQAESNGICESVEIKKEKTKPLPIYTEATLLKDLQRVARYVENPRIKKLLIEKDKGREGENGGIGTPATRSAVIKNLNDKGFFEYQGKKLIPTQKGIDFIEALPRIVTVPDTTALWFEQQLEIEKGKLSVDEFLDEIEKFVDEQIEASKNVKLEVKGEPCSCGQGILVLKKFKESEFFACTAYPACTISKPALNGLPAPNCPCCGSSIRVNDKGVFCSNENCLKLWRKVAEKSLSDSQLLALLSKGKTQKIKGFKSKTGKEFEAVLKLNKSEKKIKFEFDKK